MLRDFTVWLSEVLFYLLNGVPLINTPWIFAWVVFWSLVMIFPLWYTTHVRVSRWSIIGALLFVPVMMLMMGPGIVQHQMLQECETVESVIATKRIDPTVIVVKQCRAKDNYYSDFGEWKIIGQPQ